VPIQTYLPHFPVHDHPHSITARHLASHLSGVRHYLPDLKDFYSTTNFASVHDAVEVFINGGFSFHLFVFSLPSSSHPSPSTSLSVLQAIKDYELVAPPGTKYHYSTFGYTILSAVLEKAYGKNYLTLMQEKVFPFFKFFYIFYFALERGRKHVNLETLQL
jgi:serine beta-lactamase-like protein LACTB, mitochondrial